MAYFANGTEALSYEEAWCSRCAHYPRTEDAPACPVMALHWHWVGESVSARNDRYDGKEAQDKASEAKLYALDLLIPEDERGRHCQCAMFVPAGAVAENPTRRAHRELRELLGVG